VAHGRNTVGVVAATRGNIMVTREPNWRHTSDTPMLRQEGAVAVEQKDAGPFVG